MNLPQAQGIKDPHDSRWQNETMIDGRRGVFHVAALAVAALVVAVCFTGSIEASPVVHHECSAVTGETGLCKPVAPVLGLSAIVIDVPIPIQPRKIASGELPAPSDPPLPAAVPGGCGLRSPPASPSSRSI
jgi:hypothetical protein